MTAVDGGEPEIEVTFVFICLIFFFKVSVDYNLVIVQVDDDPGAFGRLDVAGAPLLVTLSRSNLLKSEILS